MNLLVYFGGFRFFFYKNFFRIFVFLFYIFILGEDLERKEIVLICLYDW